MAITLNRRHADQETIIQVTEGWFTFDWQELWQFRDLLVLFVQREFISRYRQTILGPLWYVIQPVLLTGVLTVVFGKVGGMSTDGLPPILFYLCGLVTWGYFVQTFEGTAHGLVSNSYIFSKVYFPRLIIPLSVAISKLLVFSTQFILFLAVYAYYKIFTVAGEAIHPQIGVLLLTPLLVLMSALFSLGVGLWFAAATVKYRDFSHLTTFLLQLWFYATPIIFPLSRVPKKYLFWARLNPMATVVDGFRTAFLGQGEFTMSSFFFSACIVFIVFFSGLLLFNRVERNFVDIV